MFAPLCAALRRRKRRGAKAFFVFAFLFRGQFLKSFFHETHEIDQKKKKKEIKTKRGRLFRQPLYLTRERVGLHRWVRVDCR